MLFNVVLKLVLMTRSMTLLREGRSEACLLFVEPERLVQDLGIGEIMECFKALESMKCDSSTVKAAISCFSEIF